MPADRLSLTFAALADPTRRAMLARLLDGEASVTELAAPFDMSLPAISKHLKVLENAGLIARSRDAQWRPCHLEAAPLREVAEWAERYRQFWDQSFDRLDRYLAELQKKNARATSSKKSPSAAKSKRPAAKASKPTSSKAKPPKSKTKKRTKETKPHGRK
jgi:DNA-binding transcriptional ArsR family regulator